MTPFTKKVMAIVKKIPRGKIASYKQIAELAGKPQGARGVGWILNACGRPYKLPWQRVVNSKGKISFPKHTKEYREQKKLLSQEKVKFSPNDAIAFEVYGWNKKSRKAKRPANTPRMFSN
jgi:methylated-DNA-protein-cysteine methyltransferase-like protein